MFECDDPTVVWIGSLYGVEYRVVLERHTEDEANITLTVEEKFRDAMGDVGWARVPSGSNSWGDVLALALEELWVRK